MLRNKNGDLAVSPPSSLIEYLLSWYCNPLKIPLISLIVWFFFIPRFRKYHVGLAPEAAISDSVRRKNRGSKMYSLYK